jgi:hypothetical protein
LLRKVEKQGWQRCKSSRLLCGYSGQAECINCFCNDIRYVFINQKLRIPSSDIGGEDF